MRFGTAIERLVDNYQYAKSKIWIRDEVAWALYHTWKEADDRKTEPSNSEKPNNCEPKICDTCRYYNSNIPCGTTPSACKEADKFAEEFVDGLKKLKPKDEPQRDCFLCKWLGDVDVCGRCRNRNLFAEADTEPKPKDEPTISKMEQVEDEPQERSE